MINKLIYVFIYVAFAFLVLYRAKFMGVKGNQFNEDCFSLDACRSIKGICAVVVIMHHLSLHFYNDRIMLPFMQSGKYAVSVFFFFTGFGLMKSFLSKPNYFKHFISTRLSKVLIPSIVAGIVYCIVESIGLTEKNISIMKLVLGKELIIPYSWFVYQIVLVYVAFYFIFKYIRNIKVGVIIFFTLTVIDVLLFAVLGYELFWSIGIVCVVLGVLFAYKFDEILKLVKKKYYLLTAFCSALFAFLFVLMSAYFQDIENKNSLDIALELIITNATCILFCLLLVLVIMKFRIGNRATDFFGKISFELYLYQGLAFEFLFQSTSIPNPVVWMLSFALCVSISVLANASTNRGFGLMKRQR